MAHDILLHTPTWVWALLLALVWAGLRQTLTRQVSLTRVTVLPLVLVGLSLYGTATVFASQPWVLLVWAKAALLVALLVLRRPVPQGTRFDLSSQTFTLPGSWAPLVLITGIFCTKYAVGVTAAVAPALLHSTPVALGVGALCGVFSGVLGARTLRLWRLAAAADAAWHGQTTRSTAAA